MSCSNAGKPEAALVRSFWRTPPFMRVPKASPDVPQKSPFLFIGAKLTITSPLDKVLDQLSYRSRDFFCLYCVCYNIASMFFGHKPYGILVPQPGIKHPRSVPPGKSPEARILMHKKKKKVLFLKSRGKWLQGRHLIELQMYSETVLRPGSWNGLILIKRWQIFSH